MRGVPTRSAKPGHAPTVTGLRYHIPAVGKPATCARHQAEARWKRDPFLRLSSKYRARGVKQIQRVLIEERFNFSKRIFIRERNRWSCSEQQNIT